MSATQIAQWGDLVSTQGFTLVELLVALSVAVILVVLAVPSYRALIARDSVAAQTNDLLADLNYARDESVTRGTWVRVCKSADAASCADNGGWQQGWIVYADIDNDRKPASADILRVHAPLKGGNTFFGNRHVADDVRFNPNGFALGFNGRIFACDDRGGNKTDIVIANSGRIQTRATGRHDKCIP